MFTIMYAASNKVNSHLTILSSRDLSVFIITLIIIIIYLFLFRRGIRARGVGLELLEGGGGGGFKGNICRLPDYVRKYRRFRPLVCEGVCACVRVCEGVMTSMEPL